VRTVLKYLTIINQIYFYIPNKNRTFVLPLNTWPAAAWQVRQKAERIKARKDGTKGNAGKVKIFYQIN
jgi:hypothetical protein